MRKGAFGAILGAIVVVGIGVAVGLGITYVLEPTYRSTAKVMVMDDPTADLRFGAIGYHFNLVYLLNSASLAEAVAERSEGVSRGQVARSIETSEEAQTRSVSIALTAESPEAANERLLLVLEELRNLDDRTVARRDEQFAASLERSIQKQRQAKEAADAALLDFERNRETDAATDYVAMLNEVNESIAALNAEIGSRRASARDLLRSDVGAEVGVPSIDRWKSRVAELEYDLEVQQEQFGPDSVQLQRTLIELDKATDSLDEAIRGYVATIESGLNEDLAVLQARLSSLRARQSFVQGKLDQRPDEQLIQSTLQAEANAQGRLLAELETTAQSVLVEDQRLRPRWLVLDPPSMPVMPSNKRYALNGAATGVAALIAFLAVAYWRARGKANDADPTVA